MPRKEENERKARERAAMQPALDCEACGALTPGERFRYYADQIVCEACNERNPQSRRRLVPRALLQPRSVCVNFLECRGLALQAMALDHRTMLGPQLRIQSADTLRRLLKDDPMKWDGKVYRPAGRASVGTLPTVRNGKPRTPGGARSMRKCELRKFETALCGIPSGRNRRCGTHLGRDPLHSLSASSPLLK